MVSGNSKYRPGEHPSSGAQAPAGSKMARRLALSTATFVFCLGVAADPIAPAYAFDDPAADDPAMIFADLAPLAAPTLDAERGGFKVGGFDINMGVSVSSSIDGLLEVISKFSVATQGGLHYLGSEVKVMPDIRVDMPDVAALVAQSMAEANAKIAAAAPGALAVAPLWNDITAATAAAASASSAARLSPSPNPDTQASGSDPATLTTAEVRPSGTAASPFLPPTTVAEAVVSGQAAQIIHDMTSGQLSVIRNTIDGVSIRQNVSVDLTVDNFTDIQGLADMRRTVTDVARQIGIFNTGR